MTQHDMMSVRRDHYREWIREVGRQKRLVNIWRAAFAVMTGVALAGWFG